MPKVVKPLSFYEIKNSKPKDKGYRLFDGQGLNVFVSPHGRKYWRFCYKRPFTKKSAEIALGEFPHLSIQQARELRDTFLSDLAMNVDPQFKKKQEEAKQSVADVQGVYDAWLNLKRNKILPSTLSGIETKMRLHVLPKYGKLHFGSLTVPMVLDMLKPLEEEGKFNTRKRIGGIFKEMGRCALSMGVIAYNPFSDLPYLLAGQYEPKNRETIKPVELPDLINDVINSNEYPITKLLFIFQLLTMVRPTEAWTAEWQDFDLKNALWNIPKEKMKGQKNKKREHVVPLSIQAMKVLEILGQFTQNHKYIFSPKYFSKRNYTSNKITAAMLRRIGYQNVCSAHGLRSIASTYLNDQGENGDFIEACLSHKVGGSVRNAYNHSIFLELRKPIMQKWGDYVEKCGGADMFERILIPKKYKPRSEWGLNKK